MDWKNKPNMIFNKVKNQMFAKGVESFYYVDVFIREFDPQFTGKLTPHFFNLFMNKIGVFFTTQQIRNIKDLYVSKGEQTISYMEFLNDVKYSIPEKVADLINAAYNKLDQQNAGSVSLDFLIKSYSPKQHPHVLARRKDPEQVYGHFVNGITRKAQNDRVKRQGFIDYYAQLNFCISNERQNYFCDLLRNTWGLNNPSDYVSQQRLKELQLVLYEKIRQKSDGKTNQWKTAKKALHFFDLSDAGTCDYQSFKRGLDKFGCNFKQFQMNALFNAFDVNQNGKLEYEEFAKRIMDIDINGMISKPNLLTTLGTNYFKVTH